MFVETDDKFWDFSFKSTIDSEEELQSAQVRLDKYLEELAWAQQSGEPEKELLEKIQVLLPMVKDEHSKGQLHYRRRLYDLMNTKTLMKQREQYVRKLEKNIEAVYAKIKKYEVDHQDFGLVDSILGHFQKKSDVYNAVTISQKVNNERILGDGLKEENLFLQSPDFLREYMEAVHDWVGIDIHTQPETALVVSDQEATISKNAAFFEQLLKRCLEENAPQQVHDSHKDARPSEKQENLEKQQDFEMQQNGKEPNLVEHTSMKQSPKEHNAEVPNANETNSKEQSAKESSPKGHDEIQK